MSAALLHLSLVPSVGMFEGVEVSSRQPRLFTGGIMRDYQLDGMEWLKVLTAHFGNWLM